jgi:hypothetical protein
MAARPNPDDERTVQKVQTSGLKKGTQDNNMKTRMWCFDELGTVEVTLKPPIIFKKALSSLF